MILGTEEYQELMESVSRKCNSQFSRITPVPNTSSSVSAGEIQTADFLEEIENAKITGDLNCDCLWFFFCKALNETKRELFVL